MFPPERLQPLLQENPACDLRQRKPSARIMLAVCITAHPRFKINQIGGRLSRRSAKIAHPDQRD
jgi:hypothetical protein